MTADQYKLYRLIWERFIASQMADALMDTVSVDIEADNCIFKATGSTVKFDGFTVLYDDAKGDKSENKNLPELEKGMEIKVKRHHGRQPALHPGTATLYRGDADQGAGRERHRPTEYLCADHHHHHHPPLCGA